MSTMLHYMAGEVERRNRFEVERAGRYRLFTEARSVREGKGSQIVAGIRHRSGGTLIRIGTRLSGTPRLEPNITTRPAW
jgi:hypothetical protein